MDRRRRRAEDRTGFDDTTNYLTLALAKLVPRSVARRAVSVAVWTDRDEYEPGEPVEITVEFHNRLPVPVEVPTPRRRRWGWTVDGLLEATDERRYVRGEPATFAFRAGERKRVTTAWNGRVRRSSDDDMDRSEPAGAGEHTITAFLATRTDDPPADETTVRFVRSRRSES
ncbi:hypothetical protein HUG12_06905 [Halorarum salinum]|uniref:DUF7974 domain-containing protein n=2 Tax=Halorarum salinum TaxID=2743089 RepID=A0A7D5QA49_9EURY|nr:hypothetical protein [Halobaculum salinum]QLG61478.1 hypothetical protein HUG12_06905 [Halobaculum salinum]